MIMNKLYNRVQSEFENILVDLSKNPATNYSDAYKKAKEYVDNFGKKKSLSDSEKTDIMDYCLDLIADWYPNLECVNL